MRTTFFLLVLIIYNFLQGYFDIAIANNDLSRFIIYLLFFTALLCSVLQDLKELNK